jgi:hypothetical protein
VEAFVFAPPAHPKAALLFEDDLGRRSRRLRRAALAIALLALALTATDAARAGAAALERRLAAADAERLAVERRIRLAERRVRDAEAERAALTQSNGPSLTVVSERLSRIALHQPAESELTAVSLARRTLSLSGRAYAPDTAELALRRAFEGDEISFRAQDGGQVSKWSLRAILVWGAIEAGGWLYAAGVETVMGVNRLAGHRAALTRLEERVRQSERVADAAAASGVALTGDAWALSPQTDESLPRAAARALRTELISLGAEAAVVDAEEASPGAASARVTLIARWREPLADSPGSSMAWRSAFPTGAWSGSPSRAAMSSAPNWRSRSAFSPRRSRRPPDETSAALSAAGGALRMGDASTRDAGDVAGNHCSGATPA